MSKTIDQRVVEMQFDNKNFEQNVSQSMSTLDKLKEKLSFKGASKAVDELNGAMGKVNTSVLEKAIDGVGNKFSALEQVAIGALRRIGDQVTSFAEQTIKSMSGIENMAAGWSKFGEKTTSVSTLIAQGYELEEVNEQLEKLNWFTDETSYNFTDMVNEIGKFTASGQGLEDSVTAMMGIANWAALSGQNASVASRAMYQLSQAMSKGALRYDDWKSIQNASMDTKEFRQMAAEAAISLGSLVKVGDDAYKLVYEAADGTRELSEEIVTLNDLFTSDYLTQKQWLDTDVMMSTFNSYGKASKTLKALIDDGWEDVETASSAMEVLEEKAKATAEEFMKLYDGEFADYDDAFNSALKRVSLDSIKELDSVKDEVNQYIASVKESTGETLSFDDALWELGYGIDAMSLKALKAAQQARTWTDVVDSVKDAVSTGWMNTFEKIFGNQEEAVDLWTRLANDFWDIFASGGESRNDIFSVWRDWIDPKTREMLDAAKGIPSAVRDALAADATVNGRDLLFSTDENNLGAIISLLNTIKTLLSTVKDAWNEIFYGTTDADVIAQKKADTLMAITKALKAFADAVAIDEVRGDKLRRTFKGLFAILDIIGTFLKTAFKAVWTGISSVFGLVDVDVLDMTASFGDMLVQFRDWIKESGFFENVFGGIGKGIATVVGWVKSLIDYVSQLPFVVGIIDSIKTGFSNLVTFVTEFFSRLGQGEGLGNILSDIGERLKTMSPVWEFIIGIIEKVKGFFGGIKDVAINIGNFFMGIIQGLINGFSGIGNIFGNIGTAIGNFWTGTKENLSNAKDGISGFIDWIKEALGQIDGNRLLEIIAGTAVFIFIFKMISLVKTFLGFFDSVSDAFSDIAEAVKNFGKVLSKTVKNIGGAIASNIRAKTLMTLATAILMLVGAIAALYFITDDPGKLAIIAGVVTGLMIALVALSSIANKSKGLYKIALGVVSIAGALFILVLAVNQLNQASLNGNGWESVGMVAALAGILLVMTAIAAVASALMSKFARAGDMKAQIMSLAALMISFAGSLLILAGAARVLSTVDPNTLEKVTGFIAVIMGMLSVLVVVTSIFKNANFKGLGLMLLEMAGAMIIFASAILLFSLIPIDTFNAGLYRMAVIESLCVILIAVSKLAGESASKAGLMMLELAGAFLIMVGLVKLISLLKIEELVQGMIVMTLFSGIVVGLMAATKLMGNNAKHAGLIMLEFSIAMAILTGVLWALAYIPVEGLVKGLAAIAAVMAVFALLIAATKNAKDVSKTIITLTVAIGVIAASLFALSMISERDLIKAAGAMALVTLMFAALVGVTKFAQNVNSTLIILIVAIAAIGGILITLATMGADADAAMKNAGAMAIMLLALSAAMILISKFGTNIAGILVGTLGLLALSGVIAILALVLQDMAKVTNADYLGSVAALSVLLLAMAAVIAIVSMFGNLMAGMAVGILGLYALSGVVAILSAILQDMAKVTGADYMASVGALSVLLLAMAGVIAIISMFGNLMVGILVGVVALYALSGVVAILSAILQDMANATYGDRITDAQALSTLLLAMTGALVVLSAVGVFAVPAILGIALLDFFVMSTLELFKKVGELMEQMPQLESFIDQGIPIFEKLGSALGGFFGNAVGGFIEGVGEHVLNLLPTLGKKLTEFSVEVQPFLDQMASVDSAVLTGVATIAGAVVALTAAEFINGIQSFANGILNTFLGEENGSKTFADNLQELGAALVAFNKEITNSAGVKTINTKAITEAAESLKALVEVENGLTGIADNSSLFAKIFGSNDVGQFGERLKALGTGIKDFNDAVSGGVDKEKIKDAVDCLNLLVDLEKSLSPTGPSIIAAIVGMNDLETFGNRLPSLGLGLAGFYAKIKNETFDEGKITTAVDSLNKLAALESSLDMTKGGGLSLLSIFVGENDLATFASKLPYLGSAIAGFSREVTAEGAFNPSVVDSAVTALERLSSIENGLDGSKGSGGLGGFLNFITGQENNLKIFGERLPDLAKGIVKFSKELSENGFASSMVTVAIEAISDLANIESGLEGGKGWGFLDIFAGQENNLALFGERLPLLGVGIAGFATAVNLAGLDSDKVSRATSTAINCIYGLSKIENAVGTEKSSWSFIGTITALGDLTSFSVNFPLLANAIVGFAQGILATEALTGVNTAVDVLTKMSEMNGLLDQVADAEKLNTLNTNLTSYKDSISNLGDILVELGENSSKYDADTIKNISDRIDEISALADKAGTVDTTKITNLTNTMSTSFGNGNMFGIDLSTITGGSSGTGGIFDAISGISLDGAGSDILSTLNFDMNDIDMSAILGKNGEGGIAGAISGIDLGDAGSSILSTLNFDMNDIDLSAITGSNGTGGIAGAISSIDLSGAGDSLIGSLTGALNSETNTTNVEQSGKDTAASFITGYESKYGEIAHLGTESIDGLIGAIKGKTLEVGGTGTKIADAFIEAIETRLDINSPSRVMYDIGEFAGQGFVNALTNYVDVSANAGEDIATAATDSLRDALAKSAASFDTSVDVQPTIRPVLDLSNINEGIGELDGMFDANRSIALAGSANFAMEAAAGDIQNEIKVDNSDVVTAITDLQTDMADMVDKITNMQIYLDKNVLVGQMAAPMDKALGTNYRRNLRQ